MQPSSPPRCEDQDIQKKNWCVRACVWKVGDVGVGTQYYQCQSISQVPVYPSPSFNEICVWYSFVSWLALLHNPRWMAEGKTAAGDKSRCCRHDGRKVYCKVAWYISSIPSSDSRVEWHEKTLLWWRNTYSPLAKECLLRSFCHHEFGVVGTGRQPSMQCQEWASDGTSFQEVATKTEYIPSPRNVASIHHTNNMLTCGRW